MIDNTRVHPTGMAKEQRNDLYHALVGLCQEYGFTTEHTYQLLHGVVESIRPDDGEDE